MVKLAQHIEWPSQLSSKAGEGPSSNVGGPNAKKVDRLLSNGKPRKTLAELFEARATPMPTATPSSSSSSATTTPTTLPLSTTAPSSPFSSSTLLPVSSGAPSSSSSSSSLACTSSLSASSMSSFSVISSSRTTPSSGTAPAHVTFNDNLCNIQRKSSAHKSSEVGANIKRSSSARKIADSSAHEGFETPISTKKISKSGPLTLSEPSPRSPFANTSNSEPARWISPAKPSDGIANAKSNEKPAKSSRNFEQEQRTPLTYSSNSEQRVRSPFHAREHNQKGFFPKAIDFVGGMQNQSRFKQGESDPLVAKRHDAEHVDKLKTVQGTPTKGKKLRRGLFGLLTDGGGTKHAGSEARESEISGSRVSEKFGKPMNATLLNVEMGGFVRLPRKIAENVGLSNESANGEMQQLGSWISGNVGKHEDGREAKSLTIEIPDKMVGLAWFGTVPRLLLAGTYSVPSEGFMLEQVVSERSSYVKHGMLHRVRIREGHLGVAWVDGKAVLLEEGVSVHMCPSNRFSYITTDDKMISEKEFVLGPFRVVTVNDSEVGIKFCNRQPQILYTGRHCLSISKVEVFAGFESVLRRQSNVREASALSSDNMKVTADVWLEWQIKAEDAAAARLANITDVEGAVCSQVRRAFNLVVWEVNGHDLKLQLMGSMEDTNAHTHPLLKNLSSSIHRESQDLFEEGWTVTIWDLQVRQLDVLPEVRDGQG